jgi:hypothetical protein
MYQRKGGREREIKRDGKKWYLGSRYERYCGNLLASFAISFNNGE